MVSQSAERAGVCGGERPHLSTIVTNHGVTEVDWTLKTLQAFEMGTALCLGREARWRYGQKRPPLDPKRVTFRISLAL